MQRFNSLMKKLLLLAAALVVARVVLERLGAPESINNVFGVVWLYLVAPVLFGIQIAASEESRPFMALFKNLVVFSAITRLMVMPTYWLAYLYQWAPPRFGTELGGVVGEGVSPLAGYLLIPIRNAMIWVVLAIVVGMILGSVTLLIRRRSAATGATA
jgi:hypothetical protein